MKANADVQVNGAQVVLVPYEHKHVAKYHTWMQSEELQELTASEPLSLEEEYAMQKSWREDDDKCTFIVLDRQVFDASSDEIEAMVGDVNLFFNDPDSKSTAEIEIMIAEPSARGKGFGRQALLMMMDYAVKNLSVTKLVAKIGFSNAPSLALFERLGFKEVSRSEVFKEVTLEVQSTELSDYARQHQDDAHATITQYQRPQ
ncbi:N-acetyltransferase 9 [Salpingoeca rosetta]|uniref:N-acetyltransferase 9 n=1 Tax=Salpingoeca rosetta (strain ATCC 50818 / BSB-021) TaxID=946362 RepID=F2TVH1_SALR5|nr:N-acetyltransferase 9 [Salpingoeca rosetta]EGD72067.1 N-acetyltransferase 9 [Salpingoeca rosetta]|eukprot:XP_004998639.1 N-acetyltransferase 9 [Salpingoeca rosetta]